MNYKVNYKIKIFKRQLCGLINEFVSQLVFSTCILQKMIDAAFFGGQIIMILQYLPLRYF